MTPAVRALIFTLLVPGSVTVGVPYLLLSSGARAAAPANGPIQLAGLVPMAVGAAIYLWCAWDFAATGKGTPGPWDAPRVFVSRGPYRRVRNPMYIGVELILSGEAIVFGSWMLAAYAALVWVIFHLFVLLYEEPALARKFGSSYQEYCRAVPRWLPGKRRAGRTG